MECVQPLARLLGEQQLQRMLLSERKYLLQSPPFKVQGAWFTIEQRQKYVEFIVEVRVCRVHETIQKSLQHYAPGVR